MPRRPERPALTPAPLPHPSGTAPQQQHRRRVVAATLVVGSLALLATLAAPRGSATFTLLGFLAAAVWLVGAAVAFPPGRHQDHPTGGRADETTCRGDEPGAPTDPDPTSTAPTDPDPTDAAPAEPDEAYEADGLRGDHTVLRWVVVAVAVGVGGLAFLGFLGAAAMARHVAVLDGAVDSVVGKAEAGPTLLVLAIAWANAVGEEAFFRGALPLALPVGPGPDRRALVAVGIYVLVTVATLNVALVLAAAVMGPLFMVERLVGRSTLAPIVTHLTWSTLMVLAFPR